MHLRRLLVLGSAIGCAMACGSRTGLLVPLESEAGIVDAGQDVAPEPDVTVPDTSLPEVSPPDASPDTGKDVTVHDAPEEDALPPIDVRPPPDGPTDCPDAGSTLVYVINEQYELLSFYPPTAVFRTIGSIRCPGGGTPYSMAVDTTGVAYIEFSDGRLYRVSTLTAACAPTKFQAGQPGFGTFGMGFASDFPDAGETLFVAGVGGSSALLGSIDTQSFALTRHGAFQPAVSRPELTGTGAGDLFAFFDTGGSSSAIAQVDKTSGHLVAQSNLPGVGQGSGWAFAFWGGDFYTFTAPAGSTVVTRFRPSDGSITQVATTPGHVIVGAGVSTCAPQQ